MRCGRRYPRPEWVFLLGCLLYTMFCPIPSFANTPHLLKDVRMVYQNGQWHVVLTGSASMPYKVIKATDPLRVVVDLPNTLSKTAITSSVKENEVVSTIKTVQFGPQTQPLARVEIGLRKDTSYRINKVQEKIWVSFGAAEPAPKDKPVNVEPAAKTKVEVPKVETGTAKFRHQLLQKRLCRLPVRSWQLSGVSWKRRSISTSLATGGLIITKPLC